MLKHIYIYICIAQSEPEIRCYELSDAKSRSTMAQRTKLILPREECKAAAVGTTGIAVLSACIYCPFQYKLVLVMSLLE
jgi:hypothetical protein